MLCAGQPGVRTLVGGKIVCTHSNWPKTHQAFYTLFLGSNEADHPPLLALELSMGKALPFIGNKRKRKETMTSKETPNMINTVVKGVNKFIYLGNEIKIQALDTRFLRGKEKKTKYRISNKIFRKVGLKNLFKQLKKKNNNNSLVM